ncbi:MAG: hypothetical protein N4A40_12840 [Tissierellales bacterium]|jgi:hypothetical protein|nr:hypothetical protein [Tissierellales bacterium]
MSESLYCIRNYEICHVPYDDCYYLKTADEDTDGTDWSSSTVVEIRDVFEKTDEEDIYEFILPTLFYGDDETLDLCEVEEFKRLNKPEECIDKLLNSKAYEHLIKKFDYKVKWLIDSWGQGFYIYFQSYCQ